MNIDFLEIKTGLSNKTFSKPAYARNLRFRTNILFQHNTQLLELAEYARTQSYFQTLA